MIDPMSEQGEGAIISTIAKLSKIICTSENVCYPVIIS